MKWLLVILLSGLVKISVAQQVILTPSLESGIYDASFTLFLETNLPNLNIHFTTNGQEPRLSDPIYSSANGILIQDRSAEENHFSNIPTLVDNWIAPQKEVAKGTIIWAQAYQDNLPIGEAAIFSYFININHSFPIISLVGKKNDFFGDSLGILVPGINYNPPDNVPGNAGLRGRDWERPAQIEFFKDNKLELRQQIGLRIHGLSSRSLAQKSFRLYARNEYGKKYLEYPFFPNSNIERFKRLILRSPASDWSDTFFKDEMIHSLVKDKLDMDVQDHLPCIVYLNGEYWGIYNLRERQDEHYLAEKYDLDDDDFNILEANANIVEGDNQDYLNLYNFARNNDLSKNENYHQVAEWIDVDNFIDYHITELFFANQDWPRNNYKYWQATKGDQRWRWLFFDCDFCMIFHHDDHLGIFLNNQVFEGFNREGEEFPDWSILLLRNLLANTTFLNKFKAKFFQTATGLFSTDQLINRIDSFENTYAPEVAEHISRWSNPGNFDIWKNNVNDLRKFAIQRPPYLLKKFQEYVGSPFTVYPNPSSGLFHIDSKIASNELIEINILNIRGQHIAQFAFDDTIGLSDQSFLIPELASGQYIVLIKYRQVRFQQLLTII